ncbi:hypothetical protein MAPG_01685 [Magnaporthiopsis poae ATCC 64411]|uniref:RING-type domain-containing protein n=1 Tax=Magnaporthiopsis poae (strain ATCC 64411 / 73-15) TaxID=644358 RepID=A0A0C4CSA4_MAGP6|nr:hypothetical protein, variant [Magnaporthiopsis poae ATCC 64411]KLU82614.1 hypothetical protein MAPG_01685 [Magnaporthiopsis poae ATCC 64411]
MVEIIDITGESDASEQGDVAGESQQACAVAIVAVFPDICPDYLDSITKEKSFDSEAVISHILDQLDDGQSYPRRPKACLKRKRETDDDEIDEREEVLLSKRFSGEDHRRQCESRAALPMYLTTSKAVLAEAFPKVPCKHLYRLFDEQRRNLFATYLAVNDLLNSWDDEKAPFELNKRPRESAVFSDATIKRMLSAALPGQRQALEELLAARVAAHARQTQNEAEQQRLMEEEENLELARAEGTATDCECCYSECAKNRMVYCNGDDPHYFCKECARRMAETQVGLSKYALECMSTGGCDAGFSFDQKQLFLDSKLLVALERIEQEEALRLAGIENLETCPFCPFAAEYPDIEIDKEFRCQNPGCEVTSCRLCRRETHIPKTCQEAVRENGHSARRVIEEAMSTALIRKCNKCGTPFIKENGCNKMTCTRAGCHNVQCYICHKSCDYGHFNDVSRGGKSGNCPLFESVEKRHNDEVLAAEAKARQEVAEANPDVAAELLEIMVSQKVKEDDRRRRKASDALHPQGRGLNELPAPVYFQAPYGHPPMPDFAGFAHHGPGLPAVMPPAAPQEVLLAVPAAGLQALPAAAPQAMYAAAPQAAPQEIVLAMPAPGPQAAPQEVLLAVPTAVPQALPAAIHQAIPAAVPQAIHAALPPHFQAHLNMLPATHIVAHEGMLPLVPPALPFSPFGDIARQMQPIVQNAHRNARRLHQANMELLAARAAPGIAVPMHPFPIQPPVGPPNLARAHEIIQAHERPRCAHCHRHHHHVVPENPVQMGAMAGVNMPPFGSRDLPIQLNDSPPGAQPVPLPALPNAADIQALAGHELLPAASALSP